MKKMLLTIVAIIAVMFSSDVFAQAPKSEAEKAAIKARNEELMQTRLAMIKDELQLTDDQYVKFEPVYREYRRTIKNVCDNKTARVKREELTNENALKVISARLYNQLNTASVKQKYLLVFAEIIEPLQIEKLYRVDDRLAKEAR
ncbi:MAG: hypothetical protein IIV10_05825, partial [Alistipes sp.]|nr:hypothetical protein [Alistipes sp.]